MKNKYLFLIFPLLILISGCSISRQAAKADDAKDKNILPAYSGAKARIAVADFEVKAAKATGQIGAGLREMLITLLVNSNRFAVVERQVLNSLIKEQELAVSAAAPQDSGPKKGQLQTADLIITAAVTEFEPQASGGSAGVGGGGGINSGLLGGLLGVTLNKAHMALDLRIVDASTSEIIAATRVQGMASDMVGNIMGGFLSGWGLGTGLSLYSNSPMEKAIRICIIEALRYVAQNVPQKYYKY